MQQLHGFVDVAQRDVGDAAETAAIVRASSVGPGSVLDREFVTKSCRRIFTVMVRPEQLGVSRERPARANVLPVTLTNVVFLGTAYVCHFALDSGKAVQARLSPADMAALGALSTGDRVYLSWEPAAARVLTS